MMHMYLPIAGNSVNILLIFGLGGFVGLLSGIFGVGGGFLMTPLLMMFGIPPTVAAASDSNQIVGASTSGTLAHMRLGNVDIPMGLMLLIGGIGGGTLGVQVIKLLRAMGNADFLIAITYVIMLGGVGGYMFWESLQGLKKSGKEEPAETSSTPENGKKSFLQNLPFQYKFAKSGCEVSVLLPLGFGILVGVLAAIMGVGGGFIMVPVMVYLLRMPMHVVVGTSLFQILFTCVNVTIMQSYSNHTVDFVLAVLLLLGSTIGAQVGTAVSKRLKADQLKIMLASLVLLVCVKMMAGLLMTPSIMVALKGGH
jgi:uncharacterized membrane protein YfcA